MKSFQYVKSNPEEYNENCEISLLVHTGELNIEEAKHLNDAFFDHFESSIYFLFVGDETFIYVSEKYDKTRISLQRWFILGFLSTVPERREDFKNV